MKTISFVMVLAAALGCANTGENKSQEETSQNNLTVTTEQSAEEEQETMLTGRISKADLQQEPYESWFTPVYDSYEPSAEDLEKIGNNIHEYEIEVYMGTWCQDSQREVPKLFKLLELTDYDTDKLEVIAVDRNKTLPENIEASAEFQMVPTIVFYKDGKEVNRFVEFPQESLEQDISSIVTGEEYKNPYAE